MFVEGERVIVSVRGTILQRRTKSEMETEQKKRFDIDIELSDGSITTLEFNTEEIQDYDAAWSEDMRLLADKVISRMPELFHIDECIGRENIGYIINYEPKKDNKTGHIIYAECKLVNGIFRPLIPFRYIIVFYNPNVEDLNENQKKILMLHELKHIGADGKIRPHNVEDFASIVNRFGTNWNASGVDVPDILGGGDDGGKDKKANKKR